MTTEQTDFINEGSSYTIREHKVAGLKTKLDRLAKRAAKLGVAPCTYEVSERILKLECVNRRAHEDGVFLCDDLHKAERAYRTVVVHGDAPKLAGWEFCGTIEHTSAGNILRLVPDAEVPTEYRDSDRRCDHCETRRQRRDTYIVKHTEAGEYKQIGRQCIADFLGHQSPEHFLALASYQTGIGGAFDEDDDRDWEDMPRTMREAVTEDLDYLLVLTVRYTETYGWRSRTAARESGRHATADQVYEYSQPCNPKTREEIDPQGVLTGTPTDEQVATAKAVRAWAESCDTRGQDYLHNIQVLARVGQVTWKQAGLACSIVNAHQRAQQSDAEYVEKKACWTKEREERVAVDAASAHVGEVKERRDFAVTVVGYNEFESDFGLRRMYRMRDDDGNVIMLWTTNPPYLELPPTQTSNGQNVWQHMELDGSYVLKATVKEHGEYRGVKQTTIQRAKLLEVRS